MKLICILCACVFSVTLTAWPQTSAGARKAPGKSNTAVPAGKTSRAGKRPVTASKSARKSGAKGRQAVPVGSYRRGQQLPTSDRYREIQQALVDRGYFKNEPNGVWDQQSAEALKQFQTENDLSPTGKLSSLSLIRLGLGPKHESTPPQETGPVETPVAPEAVPLPPN